MTRKCKCFSTKWCIYYGKKFGKNIIHLVVTNLEWIKQLIWKIVNMTIEWSNVYAIIDPGAWFIFRKFASFIKKIASPRIMVYSFSGVPNPDALRNLIVLVHLQTACAIEQLTEDFYFMVHYFSTMCVDFVWIQVVFKIWVNFYMPSEDLTLPWL